MISEEGIDANTNGDWLTVLDEFGLECTGTVEHAGDHSVQVRTPSGVVYSASTVYTRKPDWGVYCPHGLKLIEAVPAEHTCDGKPQPLPRIGPFEAEPEREYCKACYPEGRKVRPWPCKESDCTEANYDRSEQEEIDMYYEEMRQAYYG